jgi:L-ascorbate metabolism protein UlaG (beta-lactamase superfamily)
MCHASAMTRLTLLGILLFIAVRIPGFSQRNSTSPSLQLENADPACREPKLVSTGGSFPGDRHTLAVRWIGYSNFELVYSGQVLLLDAYFDRGSMYPPLGFNARDVRKADVLLIGHGHYDHVSDAAIVARQTGAIVIGAPLTVDWVRSQSIDAKHLRAVTGHGDEVLKFEHFTVEPILARHGEPPADVTSAFGKALQSVVKPPTPEQAAEQAAISRRGISDPRVTVEGTIAYLITLDSGFRILYRDSGGKMTDFEKAAAARVGSVDLAIVATAASYVTGLVVDQAMEYVTTYKPKAVIPAHHDAPYNNLWRPTEPIFQAIKQHNPQILTFSKGYREATCFKTQGSRPN